jgi:Fe-S-cluster-containing dehydrogenase component
MEGINQMAYNRCIGTRYCANNCPYKVRRFNWLDYTTADFWPGNEEARFPRRRRRQAILCRQPGAHGTQPDVTVRTVVSSKNAHFCIQRIQEGKLTAKREGRAIMDNDVRSACQTACPTGAIVFGNLNNPDSAVSKALQRSRTNWLSSTGRNQRASGVSYSAKVSNSNEELFS